MGNEISFAEGARARAVPDAGEAVTKAKWPRPTRSVGRPADQVSLSRAYHVIQSQELQVRLGSLEMQVADRCYLLPAVEVGREIVAQHLRAS